MEYNAPAPKRARRSRSHHKNQLPAYCHCALCKGEYLQNSRTLEDHKVRYPRQTPSPERVGPHEVLDQDERDDDMDYSQNVPRLNYPRFPSPRLQSPSRSGSIERSMTPDNMAQSEAERPAGAIPPVDAGTGQDFEEQELDVDVEELHPFDHLLDNEPPNQNRIDLDDYIMHHDQQEMEDPAELDELDDADFGIPEGDDEPPVDVAQEFQLPEEDEPENAPDGDDPDAQDNPGARYAAFEEPPLIRNAYIDAYVQKNLYGATHRALRHQLKSTTLQGWLKP
ncbi:hypothetical protein RSOL_072120, partial [Rhizoctonia solani AG-3 Rhs1AP]